MKKVAIVVVALLLIVYVGASWFFSGMILNGRTDAYSPADATERVLELGFVGIAEPELVEIENGDVILAGSYYEHPQPAGCAVVALHGRGGNRLGSLRFAQPFWDMGCHFVAYDSRGFGDSSTEAQTYGFYEKEDAAVVYQWMLDQTELSNDDVGLVGVSYGASVSLQTLAIRDDIGFILADSPYQSLEEIVGDQGDIQFGSWTRLFLPGAFLFTGLRADVDVSEIAPVNIVADKRTPILLIHALEDEFTAASHSEAIFANSNNSTTVLHITDWGAGHGASIARDYEAYNILVEDFLKEYAPEFGN